jgi:hypothetical protein
MVNVSSSDHCAAATCPAPVARCGLTPRLQHRISPGLHRDARDEHPHVRRLR